MAWLDSTQMFGIKLGLENIRRLLQAINNPKVPCIHVAGTNGKGSVCAMMDSILRCAGKVSGLYTSPHLVHFSERIRIQGHPIPQADLEAGLTRLREVSATWEHSPTFFEISTALALGWFANRCEVAIIETGMGGRLDATNVVDPLVSVITPVALDHTKWLGETPAQIATEKAGIIKPGRPVVSAPQSPEVTEVLQARAAETGSELQFVTSPWEGPVGLIGPHQKWNASLAVLALKAAGLLPEPKCVQEGLARVQWPGRFQVVANKWILDGAHNPHAIAALIANWKSQHADLRVPVIFGCLGDKDAAEIVKHVEALASELHLVPVRSDRTLTPAQLAPLTSITPQCHASLSEAIAHFSKRKGPILITGSLFLVGEAMECLSVAKSD
jgi:dihydrofolate synthase/folylpolyglutamate synthase